MAYEAIIAIVERGKANAVVKKASEAGARGATIAYGRGSGEHVFSFFRSLQIEPSKEIIFIICKDDELDKIYNTIVEAAKVKKKGMGIVFTVPLGRFTGADLQDIVSEEK